jgi:hypothetical protein
MSPRLRLVNWLDSGDSRVSLTADWVYTQSPVSLTPDSPESSRSTNQGEREMMRCPLTNQGRYAFTIRIGAKAAEILDNQI